MNWHPISEIKWLGVDFDDTVARNSGFPDYVPSLPVEGAVEALKKLDEQGYKIIIYTARPWSDYHNLESWCAEHEVPARRIICGKPLFKFIIDDKNIEFRGDWKAVLAKLGV